MTELLDRLKQRKLVQWAIAYVAFAFALLQGIDIVAQRFAWPEVIERLLILALCVGFFIVLVLAWYHGEKGAQKVTGTELAILALLLAIGGGLLWRHGKLPAPAAAEAVAAAKPVAPTPPQAAIPAKSIAVLPFENLSDDKQNEYFVAGMQDLILTKLADVGELKVASRTSTARYASRPEDLRIVAHQLGVANVLEGSVQKAGDQVLVNVQLIDAATDRHLWAESYQRRLDNIFGVEGEVAGMVAEALHAQLTKAESAAVAQVGTRDPAAMDAYLRARYYLNNSNRSGDIADLERSVALSRQAIAADSRFLDAYTLLALAYTKLGGHSDDAEAATRRALALDPDNAKAHTQLAFVLTYKGQFDAAIAEARSAVSLPLHGSSDVSGLAMTLLLAGRIDEAVDVFQRNIVDDPQSYFGRQSLAWTQAMRGNYMQARDGIRRVVADDPGNAEAVRLLAQIERFGWGDLAAARKALQSAASDVASSATLSSEWFELDMAARDYPAALAVLAQAPSTLFEDVPRALYLARVYRGQTDATKARDAFATAAAEIEAKLVKSPGKSELHAALAQAWAGQGKGDEAVAEAARAVALIEVGLRFVQGSKYVVNLADVQMRAGRGDDAIHTLESLQGKPAGLDVSAADLRINPGWDPIRADPGFQALLKTYEKSK